MQENEIFRYVYFITGEKLSDEIEYYPLVCKPLAYFYSGTEWKSDGSPGRKIDSLFNDFQGVFDASEAYDSSSDDGEWIKNLSLKAENPFVVNRPEEFEDALENLSDLEKFTNEEESSGEEEINEEEEISEGKELSENEELYRDNEEIFDDEVSEEDAAIASAKNLPSVDDSKTLPEKTSVEKRLLTNERKLSLYAFDEEVFSIQNTEDSSVQLVSDGKRMIRKFFDSKMRLTKKETWKPSTSVKDVKLLSTENFHYENEDDVKPSSKTLETENSRENFVYDESGRVQSVFVYGIYGKNENDADSKKDFLLLSKTEFKYTEENRLEEEKYTEYEYSSSKYGRLVGSFEKKENYDYSKKDFPPDYYYYENGRLCMKTVYSEKNDWISAMYFEGGFSVESNWVNGRLVRDDYYVDGSLKRSRSYD